MQRYNLSLVVAGGLTEQTVSLSVHEETLGNLLTLVARQVSAEIVQIGSTYYLGQVKKEDRGILVTRIVRLDPSEIEGVVGSFLSEVGTVSTVPGGVVIVSDTVTALQRVQQLSDQLNNTTGVMWCVQLYVLRNSFERLRSLGVDFTPAAEIGYTFAAASSGLGFEGDLASTLTASLDAIVQAEHEDGYGSTVYSPFLLVQDGTEAKLTDGTRRFLPIATESVETGNTVRTGFQELSVGFSLTVACREVDERSGRLNLDLELSDADSFGPGGEPVLTDQSLSTVVEVVGGGVYLVGSLSERQRFGRYSELFSLGATDSRNRSSVDVWARIYRVGGEYRGRTERKNGTRVDGESTPIDGVGVTSEGILFSESRTLESRIQPEGDSDGGRVLPDAAVMRWNTRSDDQRELGPVDGPASGSIRPLSSGGSRRKKNVRPLRESSVSGPGKSNERTQGQGSTETKIGHPGVGLGTHTGGQRADGKSEIAAPSPARKIRRPIQGRTAFSSVDGWLDTDADGIPDRFDITPGGPADSAGEGDLGDVDQKQQLGKAGSGIDKQKSKTDKP